MSLAALALVLVSAFMHASWNLLAKRSHGGATFVWLFNALGALVYAPFVLGLVFLQRPHFNGLVLLFLAGDSLLHMSYFLMLQRGYRAGDLSLVYPLARGTGPLFTTIAAILFFGEHPTPVALIAVLLIIGGVAILTSSPHAWRRPGARVAATYGLLTGLTIAGYTLWDKQAVSTVMIPPLLLTWAGEVGQTIMLAPYATRHWSQVRAEWRDHRREVIGVAVLSPLAYIMVLTALVFTPVSYVAPAREVSILIGTLMGARLLSEGEGLRRLAAGGAIVLGIVTLVVR